MEELNGFVPARTIHAEEEGKLRDLEQAIKTIARLAPPDPGSVITLPQDQLTLSPGELRAFQMPYEKESSFRADYAAGMRRLVVLHVRMVAETEAYRERQNTIYLWQQHVGALAYLQGEAEKALRHVLPVIELARTRGLAQRVEELAETQMRVSSTLQTVTEVLASCQLRSREVPAGQAPWDYGGAQGEAPIDAVDWN